MVENLPANAGDTGSIPGWGTKIPHAAQCGQQRKKREKNRSVKKPKDNYY